MRHFPFQHVVKDDVASHFSSSPKDRIFHLITIFLICANPRCLIDPATACDESLRCRNKPSRAQRSRLHMNQSHRSGRPPANPESTRVKHDQTISLCPAADTCNAHLCCWLSGRLALSVLITCAGTPLTTH